MPIEVVFPKVDMDMEYGELTEWLCNDGDIVNEGDPIFVIETDKSGMEIESPSNGKIAFAGDYIGQQVKVGHVLAYLYSEDEDQAELHSSTNSSIHSSVKESSQTKVKESSQTKVDKKTDVELLETHRIEPVNTSVRKHSGGDRASPAARKLANENGISLSHVVGTARNGRVVKSDVVTYLSNLNSAVVQPGLIQSGTVQSDMVLHNAIFETTANLAFASETVPHSKMRATIASRLAEATRDIPSYQISIECNCSSLLRLKSETDVIKTTSRVSINDLFVKALALSLRDHPHTNSTWTDNAMLVHKSVDIGIAVALDEGLITPLVKDAANLSLLQIAAQTSALIDKAKKGTLQPSEYQGGSTTISNLGMFGIDEFTSIINPPQASIVSIGAIQKKPIVDSDGKVVVAPLCKITFSFDHRLIDGAIGAKLADSFRTYVENAFSLTL